MTEIDNTIDIMQLKLVAVTFTQFVYHKSKPMLTFTAKLI